MLYEIAHIIKERFGFLWDAIEWGNAEVFALMHRGEMNRIPKLLAECSGRYQLRLATREDVEQMRAFFEAQPEEAFRFFQPHEFDEKSLKRVVTNKSFLTFLAVDNKTKTVKTPEGSVSNEASEIENKFSSPASSLSTDSLAVHSDPSGKKQEKQFCTDRDSVCDDQTDSLNHLNHSNPSNPPAIAGYFFMRSFVNGKTFKGYMVGIDHRGQGVAREMGIAMNHVARELGLRMFKSISPENPASLAVTKKVNDIKIIKTLDNGDMLIECFEKADIQRIGGVISSSLR